MERTAPFTEPLENANQPKEDPKLPLDVGTPSFSAIISGQLESGQIFGSDVLYCKFQFVHGNDWIGMKQGITQQSSNSLIGKPEFIWNFPLEISFRSTNPFGWPQICVSVFGKDLLNNDCVKGYGSIHLPIQPGRCTKKIPLFAPMSSSWFNEFVSWLTGARTEYTDLKFVSQSEGRQVTRVRSCGNVTVQFDVLIKGMTKYGYSYE